MISSKNYLEMKKKLISAMIDTVMLKFRFLIQFKWIYSQGLASVKSSVYIQNN